MKLLLRAKMLGKKITLMSTAFVLAVSTLTAVVPFMAAEQASAVSGYVTSTDANGWYNEDGHPSIVMGPSGNGSLMLSTETEAKQNYYHPASTPLAGISGLAYRLNVAAGVPASYQLKIIGDSGAKGWTTLVWEPTYNGHPNGPTGGFTDHNNLENGTWWSSNPIPGAMNRDTFVPLSTITANNPNAQIVGFGASIGSGTPNATSYVDSVTFQSSTYDFLVEAPAVPANLSISHNGVNIASGTTVGPSIMNGNTVLNFGAVPNAKYITHITYPGGEKDVSNNFNNTWLVKNSLTAQGEFGAHGDGVYTYAVQSYNPTTGLKSALSTPVSLTYDSNAPTITSITANGRPIALDGSTRVNSEAGVTYNVQTTDPSGIGYTYVEMNENLNWKAAQTGGSSTTLSTPANLYTNSQEYGLKICPYDTVGNGMCTQVFFTVDNTAPSLMLRVGENGPIVADGSYLNNTGKNIRIEKENTASFSVTMPDSTTWTGGVKDANYTGGKLSVDFLFVHGNGVYTFTTTDTAGNVSAPYSITIDTIAPSNIAATYTGGTKNITTPTPVSGVTLAGDVSFQISENEANPSNMYAEINWLNPVTNKWEKHAGWGTSINTNSGTLSLTSAAPSGVYQIKVSSIKDLAGNTAPTVTFGFTVDNTAPTVNTVSLYKNNSTTKTTLVKSSDKLKITAKAVDTLSGVGSNVYAAVYKCPGGNTHRLLGNDVNTSLMTYNSATGLYEVEVNGLNTVYKDANGNDNGLVDGGNCIIVYAEDTAGNLGRASTLYFTIDNTAPVATITGVTEGEYVGAVVNLVGTVTDANPKNTYFMITGPSGYKVTSKYTDGRSTHDLTWNTLGLANGNYAIQFEVRDALSNKEQPGVSVAVVNVKIDRTGPAVEFSNVNFFNGLLSADITATDAMSGIQVIGYNLYDSTNTTKVKDLKKETFTKTNLSETSSIENFDLSDIPSGDYVIRAVARDANNRSTQELYSISIDNDLEVSVLSYSQSGNVITPNVNVNEPADFLWTLTSGNPAGIAPFDSTAKAPSFTALLDGVYEFLVTVTDQSGNTTTRTFSFEYTAPVATPASALSDGAPSQPSTPTITGFSSILGGGTTIPEAAVEGASDTKGASDILAQAVDADNTNGEALGLAWYWWLLIVAAAAGLVWWIAAAIRRRNSEA